MFGAKRGTMDKCTSFPDASFDVEPNRAKAVAESVHSDFTSLISMLDRQLANVPESEERARAHILQARAGAERGLRLSAKLIELLRTAESKS
jgi:hypothetical protein